MFCQDYIQSLSFIPEYISASELVKTILGNTDDVVKFIKYRRLARENPSNSSFSQQYERAKAVVGFLMLGRLRKMSTGMLQKQTKAQLEKWGITTR